MPANRYAVCGVGIESNVPLPELPPAPERDPLCTFQLAQGAASVPTPSDWDYQCRLPNGAIWLSVATRPQGYLLRFTDLADFVVSADGTRICCHPLADATDESIRHLLLDQVIPRAMTRRGQLVLHASAVELADGAVAFLGRTGAGKSTLTAALASEGHPLVTDDCLTLDDDGDRLAAVPSYPGVRLWPDAMAAVGGSETAGPRVAHYTPKRRLAFADGGRFRDAPLPLARVYLLEAPAPDSDAQPVRLEPLSARAAFEAIIKHVYRLDITDPQTLRNEFDRAGRLVEQVPVTRLSFTRDFGLLAEVRGAILADARRGTASARRTARRRTPRPSATG